MGRLPAVPEVGVRTVFPHNPRPGRCPKLGEAVRRTLHVPEGSSENLDADSKQTTYGAFVWVSRRQITLCSSLASVSVISNDGWQYGGFALASVMNLEDIIIAVLVFVSFWVGGRCPSSRPMSQAVDEGEERSAGRANAKVRVGPTFSRKPSNLALVGLPAKQKPTSTSAVNQGWS